MNKLFVFAMLLMSLQLNAQKDHKLHGYKDNVNLFSTELLDSVILRTIDSGVLVPDQKQIFIYNNENEIIESILQNAPFIPIDPPGFQNDLHELYYYDADNRISKVVNEYWNVDSSSWGNAKDFTINAYNNGSEHPDSSFFYSISDIGDTTLIEAIGYIYDSNNRLVLEESYQFIDGNVTPSKFYKEETNYLIGDTVWVQTAYIPTPNGLNWESFERYEYHKHPDENGEYLEAQFVFINNQFVELNRIYYGFNTNKNWLVGDIYFREPGTSSFVFDGKYNFYWRLTSSMIEPHQNISKSKGIVIAKGNSCFIEEQDSPYYIINLNGQMLVRGTLQRGFLKTDFLPTGSYTIILGNKSTIKLIVI